MEKQFITAISNAGMENQGWSWTGKDGLGGADIPSFIELTWVSYAEKKFWKVEANLPADKILQAFRTGFVCFDKDTLGRATYDEIVIGLAPGGVVVVWLSGRHHREEIGRYQAKETSDDRNSFYRNPHELTQQGFFQEGFDSYVPKEAQKNIETKGIPYGLWDEYRIRYNYKFSIQFYKDDKEQPNRFCMYVNGEQEVLTGDEINQYRSEAAPFRADFFFTEKWAETEFDEIEIMTAFKELTKNNKDEPIEIIGKVGIMYKDMTFMIKSKDREIPLKKVTVAFGGYKNGKYE
jgi:hypothetical protein